MPRVTPKIFLTSSVSSVANDIGHRLGAQTKKLSLLFISTASEVEEGDLGWQETDFNALKSAGFDVEKYTVTGKTKKEVQKKLESVDVIYVGGGNTFYLLQQLRASGAHEIIPKLVSSGKIYIGSSAGSLVAGPNIEPSRNLDNVKKAPYLKSFNGMNLVDVVVLPHWGSDAFRELYLNQRLAHAYKLQNKIILLTDNQYIQTNGDGLFEIVAEKQPKESYVKKILDIHRAHLKKHPNRRASDKELNKK